MSGVNGICPAGAVPAFTDLLDDGSTDLCSGAAEHFKGSSRVAVVVDHGEQDVVGPEKLCRRIRASSWARTATRRAASLKRSNTVVPSQRGKYLAPCVQKSVFVLPAVHGQPH